MRHTHIDSDSYFAPPLTHFLKSICTTEPQTLRTKVATDALDSIYHPKSYFTDLLAHGCISGMIPHLVYYHDTQVFYDKHYNEIETLREEVEEMTGTTILKTVTRI